MEYLSNHLLDHTQIWNLSLYDHTIFYKSFKWRWPQMEDDLKILKVKYLSNHLLDHTQILNLCLYDQIIFCKSLKWRQPPMEDDLKILKVKYLSNILLDNTEILISSLYDHISKIIKMTSKGRRPKNIISASTHWIIFKF